MSIQNYLNQIKTAVFGKDVRQSIHDAIKQCYDDASVDHDNANMEVKLARGTHETLNDRITENEKNQENLSSQLEQKANLNEVRLKSTPNTLNDCDEEMLAAIQNKEGQTTFNLLSIPRDESVTLNKISETVLQKEKESLANTINITSLVENSAYRGWANGIKPIGQSFDTIKYITNVSQEVELTCEILTSKLESMYKVTALATIGDKKEILFNFDNEIVFDEDFYVCIYAPTNTINISHCNGILNELSSDLNHKGIFRTSSTLNFYDLGTSKSHMYLEFLNTKFKSNKLILEDESVGFKQISRSIFQDSEDVFKNYGSVVLNENSAYRGWACAFKALEFNNICVYSNINTNTEVTCSIIDKEFKKILLEKTVEVEQGENVKIEFDFEESINIEESFYICMTAKANTSTFSFNTGTKISDLADGNLGSKGILRTSGAIFGNPISTPGYTLALDINLVLKKCRSLRINKSQIEDLNINENEVSPKVILPSTIPVVVGHEFNYYYDNAILYSTINSLLRVTCSQNYNSHWSNVDHYRYIPTDSMNTTILTFYHYFKNTLNYDLAPKTKYVVVPTNAGDGITKKCLLTGDSITQDGRYERELLNLFTSDVMNIELLGTRGEAPALHEGRGGWTSKHYCTMSEYGGKANAFWNPNTNKFDFTYYMEQQGYSKLDYFFLMLGTNDMANSNTETMKYFEEIVNSVRAYNPNIVIVVSLHPPLSSRVDRIAFKNKRLELSELIISKWDNRQNEKIFVMPTYLNIDPLWDFPYEIVNNSRHNNDYIQVTDNTHFLDSGYNKIADTIYYMIKYIASLGY